jgi:hypothetical protein
MAKQNFTDLQLEQLRRDTARFMRRMIDERCSPNSVKRAMTRWIRKRIAAPFTLAMAAGALVLTACSASASIGASPTPALTAPPPTPAPPMVIYMQPPAPAPTRQTNSADDLVFVLLIVFAMGLGSLAAALITYYMGRRDERNESPNTPTPAASHYLVEMTPEQFYEWSQLQTYKARQIAEAQTQWMVRHDR